MRVTGTDNQSNAASFCGRSASRKPSDQPVSTEETSSSRALIPLAPVETSSRAAPAIRQPAGFLAHLIATEQALPQTRARRRADPRTATSIYAGAGRREPTVIPHVFSSAA
jgi:hypothetical protein